MKLNTSAAFDKWFVMWLLNVAVYLFNVKLVMNVFCCCEVCPHRVAIVLVITLCVCVCVCVCIRRLLLKCRTQRKMTDWHDAIKTMMDGPAAKDYVQRNRYDSFAPVRPNSYVNWFVSSCHFCWQITCCCMVSNVESMATFQLCEKAKNLTPIFA